MKSTLFAKHKVLDCRLGLGLAALGRPGYINLGHDQDLKGNFAISEMENHTHQVLDLAYQQGIRYFDAARSYGRAEEFLASWLSSRDLTPDQVMIGSKWGYEYTANWQVNADIHEVKQHSLARLNQQWRESKQILGYHLDLYQIHSATLETKVLENSDILNKLAEIKSGGTAVGFTVSGPNQGKTIRKALKIEVDGKQLFDTVQATWNLLEKSSQEALVETHQAGMGVIIKEALANGRLTSRNQDRDFVNQLRLIEAEAKRLHTTPDGLALAAALAQPWVNIVLSGAARQDHLTSNLNALKIAWDEEAETVLAELIESPKEYWEKRSRLEWK